MSQNTPNAAEHITGTKLTAEKPNARLMLRVTVGIEAGSSSVLCSKLRMPKSRRLPTIVARQVFFK